MTYICVSVNVSIDGEVKARLCPLVEYSKPDKSGAFINLNQSIWLDGSQAAGIRVGDSKKISYSVTGT